MLPVRHSEDIAKRQLTPNTPHDFQKVFPMNSPFFNMQGSPPELGSLSSGHSLPLESRQRTPQHLPGSALLPQFTPTAAPMAKASASPSPSPLADPRAVCGLFEAGFDGSEQLAYHKTLRDHEML